MLFGCTPERTEVLSKVSPGGSVIATRVLANYGATVDYVTEIHLHPSIGEKAFDDETRNVRLINDKCLSLKWTAENTLLIKYADANILEFRNRFYTKDDAGEFSYYEIVLEKTPESCEENEDKS